MRSRATRNAIVLARSALIALFLAVGCSKNKNPVQPQEPSAQLGTLVAAAGVVDANTTLLWSAPTDELVCTGAFGLDLLGRLIAIRRTTGAVRTLDSASSAPNAIAPDGSAAYYNAIKWGPFGAGTDTNEARRIALAPGATPRSFTSCVDFCAHVRSGHLARSR